MISEQLNRKAYKDTQFHQKNEDVFLDLNLDTEGLNLGDFKIPSFKVGNKFELDSRVEEAQKTKSNLDDIYVEGSYKFLTSTLQKIGEINDKYDKELVEQPYAESFLKVLPPLVTADSTKNEITWNLDDMKEKESIGKLISSLNVKSDNEIIKRNVSTLNQFIYNQIKKAALKEPISSKPDEFNFPIFNGFEFSDILTKKKFSDILSPKENPETIEQTSEILAQSLNVYFMKVSKKEDFVKHFSRFNKFIRENPKNDLFELEKIAKKKKTKKRYFETQNVRNEENIYGCSAIYCRKNNRICC
ncbi:MAG: hypothetical protein ACK5N8_06445 [Alphaproteobacteria bacterium]